MEWKFLARSLGFEQTDVDAIEYRDVRNLKEQIYQMFHEWKRREGNGATTARLLAAIKDAGLQELLKTLREKGFIVPALNLKGIIYRVLYIVLFVVSNSLVMVESLSV